MGDSLSVRAIFGGQTVTFVAYEDTGTPGALGTYTQAETTTEVTGCRHRPLPFSETPEGDIDVATQMWKTTAPPDPAVLDAKPNGVLRVDGVEYQIIGGPGVFPDPAGQPIKVTLISKRMSG
ncbi:hypothetical protein BOH72_01775 [Mycobacterium sp. WY10]|nr:hypothetical protein BOH72_01775 [Mycobacterium sp. WY10]